MRAVLCDGPEGIDGLRVAETDPPTPGAGEVLVEVAAAGVNFADILISEGKYQVKPTPPFSPGMEISGTIRAAGPDTGDLAPGRRVLAMLDHGGFAEAAIARAPDVVPIPDDLDFVTAAGFAVTYGTAHGALVWRAGLRAGETLLVHGAAGGAGLAAVEVGKALGATVIATAGGSEKLAVARERGADHGIDYRSEDIRARVKEITGGNGADVVFDPVGGEVFDASLRCTAWGGRIVVIGFASGTVPAPPANLLLVKNIGVLGFYWGSYRQKAPELMRAQFEELFQWHARGELRPHVSHTLPLERAQEALRLLQGRRSTGKVVLTAA